MKPASIVLCLSFALLGACRSGEGREGGASSSSVSTSPVRVTGTLLDAATGAPVPNVTVSGPRDAKARSDELGRFTLQGLRVGDSGVVAAETGDGRRGSVELRPLSAGTLEVVLHLAAPVARD